MLLSIHICAKEISCCTDSHTDAARCASASGWRTVDATSGHCQYSSICTQGDKRLVLFAYIVICRLMNEYMNECWYA
jgi:hypothetical protein